MIPLLFKSGRTLDIDARRYIAAVELADGQPLEPSVKRAINDFVVGCKTDGIWTAIEDCCLMLGARTLSGALVKLKGAGTVTNFNFVQADYDRKLGLKGNGSSKYLNSGYIVPSSNQNNVHCAAWMTEPMRSTTPNDFIISNNAANAGLQLGTSSLVTILRANDTNASFAYPRFTGFMGVARSSASNHTRRYDNISENATVTSEAVFANPINIFFRLDQSPSIARLTYYSIGTNINLTLLNNRVATLVSTIGAAL
jgi:hypothetical protein